MKRIILAACLFTSTVVSAGQSEPDHFRSFSGRKTFLLTLINGEELSVFLPDNEPLHLSDGSHEWEISSDNIQKLFNDGWLFGEYVSNEGTREKFSYAFTKDRNLIVHLTQENRSIELPWHKISSLCQLNKNIETEIAYDEYIGNDYDSLVAEENKTYEPVQDALTENLPAPGEITIGARAEQECAHLGFEILLDPEDFFAENHKVKVEPAPVLVGLEEGEIPKGIIFSPNVSVRSPRSNEIALSPTFTSGSANVEPQREKDSLHMDEEVIEEEEEEEDIIFVSHDILPQEYEAAYLTGDDILFDMFENSWDDISSDIFVYGFDDSDFSYLDNHEECYRLPMRPSQDLL